VKSRRLSTARRKQIARLHLCHKFFGQGRGRVRRVRQCKNLRIHLSSLITLQNLVTIFSCRVPVCTHAGPKNVGDARTIGADADMKLGAYAKRRKFFSRMPQFCVVLPQMRGRCKGTASKPVGNTETEK